MLKEKLTYAILIIDLIIFVVWPFLVFFHFIWPGIIMLVVFSLIFAGLYELYRGALNVEHKMTHH